MAAYRFMLVLLNLLTTSKETLNINHELLSCYGSYSYVNITNYRTNYNDCVFSPWVFPYKRRFFFCVFLHYRVKCGTLSSYCCRTMNSLMCFQNSLSEHECEYVSQFTTTTIFMMLMDHLWLQWFTFYTMKSKKNLLKIISDWLRKIMTHNWA